MTSALEVIAAGPGSTLQDRGRFGHQRFGVSTAGAADPLLLTAANVLVGNAADEAAIEFTLVGDTYAVETDSCRIAVAGDAELVIDGQAQLAWTSHRLTRGQRLRVGALASGARGYLAVAGGFDAEPVLGSVSTHLRSGLGGFSGTRLRPGDSLPLKLAEVPLVPERALDPRRLPARANVLRVVLGPQRSHFSEAGLAAFLGSEFTVTAEADRMGYRLDGPTIEHADGFNIISDGIPLGAIQVPGTGKPIILLADRQTTGGYPKIACVIAPDVAALAQLRPGAKLRFQAVSVEEGTAAHRAFAELIGNLPALIETAIPGGAMDSERLLSLNLIDGIVLAGAAPGRPDTEGKP
jgi:5-oxoprolinase (ATP-hydrolysing) subunit C